MERVAPPDAPKPPKQGLRSAARAHTVAHSYDPGFDPNQGNYNPRKMWVNHRGEPFSWNSRYANKPANEAGDDFEDDNNAHLERLVQPSWDYAFREVQRDGLDPAQHPQLTAQHAMTHLKANQSNDRAAREPAVALLRPPSQPDSPVEVDITHSKSKVHKRLVVRKAGGLPEEIQERIAGYKRPSEKSLKTGADPRHPGYDSALSKKIRAMLDDYSSYNARTLIPNSSK